MKEGKKEEANEVVQFLEEKQFPLSYNIYTKDNWYVKERDVRIRNEEDIVEATASIGTIDSVKDDETIDKLLLMCDKDEILNIEKALKERLKNMVSAVGQKDASKPWLKLGKQCKKKTTSSTTRDKSRTGKRIWPYCSTLLRKCLILSPIGNRP